MVKDYSFSNDEAEILIVNAVKANTIKSVIFNGKTSYRIAKTDNDSDATLLLPNTQEQVPENITTEDTATNTIPNEQEVDNVSALIERKFNESRKEAA